MSPFASLADWPVTTVAAAVVDRDGIHRHGPTDLAMPLASVTKLITAMAALVAHEEGTLPLDEPLTPEGATAADLLAHSAGIAPDRPEPMTLPHTRRIYSTAAYEILADHIAARSGIAFVDYLHEAVALPLGMQSTRLLGSAGADAHASVDDLLLLAEAWTTPLLVDASTLSRATRPHLPDLSGVLPGYGRQDPNPWGLGPEIRGDKTPHWTSSANSPRTFGHFGQSGTMLWIDPDVGVTAIALTDRDFGNWAITAWPRFSADALDR
ncbi:MAG: serine hydrolase domain-containing protein [Acidimicrobiales bacterium]